MFAGENESERINPSPHATMQKARSPRLRANGASKATGRVASVGTQYAEELLRALDSAVTLTTGEIGAGSELGRAGSGWM